MRKLNLLIIVMSLIFLSQIVLAENWVFTKLKNKVINEGVMVKSKPDSADCYVLQSKTKVILYYPSMGNQEHLRLVIKNNGPDDALYVDIFLSANLYGRHIGRHGKVFPLSEEEAHDFAYQFLLNF